MNVQNLRQTDRYLITEPIRGSFGSTEVTIVDISEHGVQIEHPQALRIGTKTRLWFKKSEVSAGIVGTVIWSHLSGAASPEGKLLYRSGLSVKDDANELTNALRNLALKGVLLRDPDSLERKRQRALDRESVRAAKPVIKYLPQRNAISPEHELLVRHARAQLKANPDEASKWYNRARFAMTEEGVHLGSEMAHDREEVLAVWEYLERSIDLTTVVRIFEQN